MFSLRVLRADTDVSHLPGIICRRNNKSGAATDDASSGSAFIPKRGEKDFEPTGHATQSGALSASRAALFSAIRGERRINSKALSLAAWDADANRAVVRFAKGQLFNSMGVTVRLPEKSEDGTKEKVESRLELLPEEALYLIERGALECYVPRSTTSEMDEQREAPMSVQQAFAVMLGADGLTRDRYQVSPLSRYGRSASF